MEITINSSTLFYEKIGTAKKHLLLFHGFGQNHNVFHSLTESHSDKYTCYSFDLFFHGNSTWTRGEKPMKKCEWNEFINAFLARENIDKFSVLGFSIGSKLALTTVELFPQKTEKIFLIAPDGIKTNMWYWLATRYSLSRKFFKSMIDHPNRFYSLIKIARKVNLINPRLSRFAEHQMDSTEKRKRVYYSWMIFRKLKFNVSKLASLINQHNLSTTIIVGQHDLIVPPDSISFFRKKINCRVKILNTSHNRLIGESSDYID